MKGRPIALLTDFGTGDPYVPAMKGAIYRLHPGAVITDVSHDIPRHDVEAAAYHLLSVSPWFPRGTIFVCVVDPGVGSRRRILILRLDGMTYIAPDNGILDFVCNGKKPVRMYALRYRDDAKGISRTFHGRDLFAPAAARLSRGAPVSSMAVPVRAPAGRNLFVDVPRRSGGMTAVGKILHIDHFGNVITNLRIPAIGPRPASVTVGKHSVRARSDSYASAPAGRPFMIVGSTGLLEISKKNGDAARALSAKKGGRVKFRRGGTQ